MRIRSSRLTPDQRVLVTSPATSTMLLTRAQELHDLDRPGLPDRDDARRMVDLARLLIDMARSWLVEDVVDE